MPKAMDKMTRHDVLQRSMAAGVVVALPWFVPVASRGVEGLYWKPLLLFVALLVWQDSLPCPASAAEGPVVSLVADAAIGKGAAHGLEKLTAAMRAKQVSLILKRGPCFQRARRTNTRS